MKKQVIRNKDFKLEYCWKYLPSLYVVVSIGKIFETFLKDSSNIEFTFSLKILF